MTVPHDTAADPERGGNYANRLRALRNEYQNEARVADRVGHLRLLVFVLLALVSAAFLVSWTSRPATLSVAVVFAAGFLYLVRRSLKLGLRLRFLHESIALNEEAQHRVAREWPALSHRAWEPASADHPYANDLDVFGDFSLSQLLSPVSAAPGRVILRSWLSHPATPAEVNRRQQAVSELAPRIDFRDVLTVYAHRVGKGDGQLTALQEWANGSGGFSASRSLSWLAVLVPVSLLALGVAQLLGIVRYPLWIVPIVASVLVSAVWRRDLARVLGPIERVVVALESYSGMLRPILAERFEAELLTELQGRFTEGGISALSAMRALRTLSRCAEARFSPMTHFILQSVTMWDFHIAFFLERWRRTAGLRVGAWMEALGSIESLAALAAIAHDNPQWSFPRIVEDGSYTFEASGLGHPLLPPNRSVRNDVLVGPAGTVLVITGSNMAGKSTLLKAIGLNLVLAQMGSVVCATDLRTAPAALHTSMKVQDSLALGVSYFMAELNRLKLILNAADARRAESSPTVFYLLDEILNGTNSAERTIAARHILARLISAGALGAVATHDLELFSSAALSPAARHVHFQERFTEGGGMYFDYRLRPGMADSSNALKLLEMVGILAKDTSMEPDRKAPRT